MYWQEGGQIGEIVGILSRPKMISPPPPGDFFAAPFLTADLMIQVPTSSCCVDWNAICLLDTINCLESLSQFSTVPRTISRPHMPTHIHRESSLPYTIFAVPQSCGWFPAPQVGKAGHQLSRSWQGAVFMPQSVFYLILLSTNTLLWSS